MDSLTDKPIIVGKPNKRVVPFAEKQPDTTQQQNISDTTDLTAKEAYIKGQVNRAFDNVIHTGIQKGLTPDNKSTEKSTVDVEQTIKSYPETQEKDQSAITTGNAETQSMKDTTPTKTDGAESKSVSNAQPKRVKTQYIVDESGNPIEYDEASLPQTTTKHIDTNPLLKSSYDLAVERNYELPWEDSSVPDNTKASAIAAGTNNTAAAVHTNDAATNKPIKTTATTTYVYGDPSSKEGFAITTKINGEPIAASNMNGSQQYQLSIVPGVTGDGKPILTDNGQQIPIFQFEDENKRTHKLNPTTLNCSVSDGKTVQSYNAECTHYFSYQDTNSKDSFTIAASRDGKNCLAVNMSTGKKHEITQVVKETKDGDKFPTLQFQDEKGRTHELNLKSLEVTINDKKTDPTIEDAKNSPANTAQGTEEKTTETKIEPKKEDNPAKVISNSETPADESPQNSPLTLFRKNLETAIDNSSPETQNKIALLAAEAQLTAKSQGLSPEAGKVLFPALILRDSKKGLVEDPKVVTSAELLLNAHKMDTQGTKNEAWNNLQTTIRWTTSPEQQAQLAQVYNAVQMQQQMMPGMDLNQEFAKELAANARSFGMSAVGEAAVNYLEADQANKVAESYSPKNNYSQKETGTLWDSMKRLWNGGTRAPGRDPWRAATPNQKWNNLPPGMTPEMADYMGYSGYNDYNNSMYNNMPPYDTRMSPNMRGPHCGGIMPHEHESMWKNPLVWMMMLQTGGSLMLPFMLLGRGGFGMGSMLPFLI